MKVKDCINIFYQKKPIKKIYNREQVIYEKKDIQDFGYIDRDKYLSIKTQFKKINIKEIVLSNEEDFYNNDDITISSPLNGKIISKTNSPTIKTFLKYNATKQYCYIIITGNIQTMIFPSNISSFFSELTSLEKISINNGLNIQIDKNAPTQIARLYENCTSLLDLKFFNALSISSITGSLEKAFYNCLKVVGTLNFDNINFDSITNCTDAFNSSSSYLKFSDNTTFFTDVILNPSKIHSLNLTRTFKNMNLSNLNLNLNYSNTSNLSLFDYGALDETFCGTVLNNVNLSGLTINKTTTNKQFLNKLFYNATINNLEISNCDIGNYGTTTDYNENIFIHYNTITNTKLQNINLKNTKIAKIDIFDYDKMVVHQVPWASVTTSINLDNFSIDQNDSVFIDEFLSDMLKKGGTILDLSNIKFNSETLFENGEAIKCEGEVPSGKYNTLPNYVKLYNLKTLILKNTNISRVRSVRIKNWRWAYNSYMSYFYPEITYEESELEEIIIENKSTTPVEIMLDKSYNFKKLDIQNTFIKYLELIDYEHNSSDGNFSKFDYVKIANCFFDSNDNFYYDFPQNTIIENIQMKKNPEDEYYNDINFHLYCSSPTFDLTEFNFNDAHIINYQFELTNITSIDLSTLNTTYLTSTNSMFRRCFDLQQILSFNKLYNLPNIISMQYMFDNCENLTSLNLSNFDTSNVTNMQNIFANCKSFTALNLNNFNTSNVTNMQNMFYNCENLTSLNLNNFNTSKTTDMTGMFSGCKNLTSLNLNNFNTSNVTNMMSMFSGCENLISLNLSNFNTSRVTDMDNMFGNCKSFTSLNLNNFDTSNVIFMSYMFSGCENLTSLNLSSFNTSNVTNMMGMFSDCTSLTSLNLSNFNTSSIGKQGKYNPRSESVYFIEESTEELKHFYIKDFVPYFGFYEMFSNCINLETLNLFEINNINKEIDFERMFYNCKKIKVLNLSNFKAYFKIYIEPEKVNNIPSEKEISMEDYKNYGGELIVTPVSQMFENCENLETIYINHTDPIIEHSNVYIAEYIQYQWVYTQVSGKDFYHQYVQDCFHNAPKLKGGNGTSNNSDSGRDVSYMCADLRSPLQFGLFTYQPSE